MDISYSELPRKCKLTPHQHLLVNAFLNFALLSAFLTALILQDWFYYRGSYYSLRGMKMEYTHGWAHFSDFRKLCKEYQLNRYSDLRDNCEEYQAFELAGLLVRH